MVVSCWRYPREIGVRKKQRVVLLSFFLVFFLLRSLCKLLSFFSWNLREDVSLVPPCLTRRVLCILRATPPHHHTPAHMPRRPPGICLAGRILPVRVSPVVAMCMLRCMYTCLLRVCTVVSSMSADSHTPRRLQIFFPLLLVMLKKKRTRR